MSAPLRDLFLRMLDALESPCSEAECKLAAEAFRDASAHEDVFVLNRGGIGPRGTLKITSPRRWVEQSDVERAIRLSMSGRGGREVVWAVGDVVGPESIPLLEQLAAARPEVASGAYRAMADAGGPEGANAIARCALATASAPHGHVGKPLALAAIDELRALAHQDAECAEAGRVPSREMYEAAMNGAFVGHRLELPVAVLTGFIRDRDPHHDSLWLWARNCIDEVLGHAEDAGDAPPVAS